MFHSIARRNKTERTRHAYIAERYTARNRAEAAMESAAGRANAADATMRAADAAVAAVRAAHDFGVDSVAAAFKACRAAFGDAWTGAAAFTNNPNAMNYAAALDNARHAANVATVAADHASHEYHAARTAWLEADAEYGRALAMGLAAFR